MQMPKQIQSRLLSLAAVFLGLYALILTLSPAVIARSWDVDYRWSHWLGYLVWGIGFGIAHYESRKRVPERDPYLLPLVALLTGWGLLTIWRLTPAFGLRQTIWLGLGLTVVIFGLRLPADLSFLRRYKYLWLTGGLLLTALTLVFGTNPMGFGPRLWLGCCGIYLQPSEPLKLLLIVYLAAYLSDRMMVLSPDARKGGITRENLLPVLAPTAVMTGLALLLLVVQRDLGTASIFLLIYSVMIYLATASKWVPVFTSITLALAGIAGTLMFDVVRLRVDAWINPWLDPSGRSYQIVQSLIAVANGGILGRGPGVGSPRIVPVSHSDFVFTALVEETGLVGSIGLFILLGLLAYRGLRIALLAKDTFRRFLAAGLTAHLVAQSVLIIGGNLRLLPLTGVTLPFVSYGGSSLMVSLVGLLILMQVSREERDLARSPALNVYQNLGILLFGGLLAAAMVNGWWSVYRGPSLLTRTDNPRRAIADRYVKRGSILERGGEPLVETLGEPGDYTRVSYYPLGPVVGYNHPVYGQSGLEASLDATLRGVVGNTDWSLWWHHLRYGQPPPGLDVRLSLDIGLQQFADEALGNHTGAVVLLNAESGEVLAMVSHPTFDPADLDAHWDALLNDDKAPLLNRVTQGIYPVGDLVEKVFPGMDTDILNGTPQLRLPTEQTAPHAGIANPIQVALTASALSSGGIRPAGRLAMAMDVPGEDWVLLQPLETSTEIMTAAQAEMFARSLMDAELPFWGTWSQPENEVLTWYVGGTMPDIEGIPLTVVVTIEEKDPALALEIGRSILQEAIVH